jgi:hypothetical protein
VLSLLSSQSAENHILVPTSAAIKIKF